MKWHVQFDISNDQNFKNLLTFEAVVQWVENLLPKSSIIGLKLSNIVVKESQDEFSSR